MSSVRSLRSCPGTGSSSASGQALMIRVVKSVQGGYCSPEHVLDVIEPKPGT